ncbi:hypothetical protein [Nostoc sp.]|uniref:hypothetical protein n=1 Tax=Nostoc sp. TaxID=1180 RepID=UPI002FF5D8EB
MLEQEFQEIITSVHKTFEHYRHWFIFFAGVNLVGYGWFAQQLAENKNVAKWVILIICLYFVFHQILAFIVSRKLVNYLESRKNRLTLLLKELDSNTQYNINAQVACPIDLYVSVLKLTMKTFPSMVFLWVAFTILAFNK